MTWILDFIADVLPFDFLPFTAPPSEDDNGVPGAAVAAVPAHAPLGGAAATSFGTVPDRGLGGGMSDASGGASFTTPQEPSSTFSTGGLDGEVSPPAELDPLYEKIRAFEAVHPSFHGEPRR